MSQPSYGEDRLYINGELRNAEGGRRYDNFSPLTEEKIGEAADATLADAEDALAAARNAFDNSDWSTNHRARIEVLRRFVQIMRDNIAELKQAAMAEVGATQFFAEGPQAVGPVKEASWVIDYLENFEWRRDIGNNEVMGTVSRRVVEKEAAGVVAAISPWNFPIQINLAKCMPALAAGCTVVLKSAPDTPWTAALLGRYAKEAGFPAGVLNVLTAQDPAEIGNFLTTDPRVDVVSFTGSTAVGRHIVKNSADTIKRVFLELGGKSAMIVLEDADLGTALFGVFSVCAHAGQGCAITTRLLVPRSRLAEAEELVKAYLGGVTYGSPDTSGELMGPLISKRQQSRVLGMIEDAKKEGARLILGGGRPAHLKKGWFVEPTVFSDVTNDMTIAQEEVFGPVLVIIPYEDEDDAVRIANDSIYGLSGAVYSADEERATAVARRIRTGTIGINGAAWLGGDAPFGGYKQSGIGREMGPEGFDEYLETKTIAYPV
ncbi:MAG: aldehyde dehydrogenase family protein [Halioglobus sp.]|nr:aldehyde dehydrogenase family protein [Halioglobus sp.]